MTTAGDALPGWYFGEKLLPTYKQLFISDENLFYAWRDKKMIRAYVNTPATAKLDLAVTY